MSIHLFIPCKAMSALLPTPLFFGDARFLIGEKPTPWFG